MSSQKESIPFLSQGQNLKLERPHVEKAIENLHKTLSEMLVILLNDQNIVNLPIRAYDLDLPGQNNESSDSKQLSFFQPMRQRASPQEFSEVFEEPIEECPGILTADSLLLILVHLVDTAHRDGIPLSKYVSRQSLGTFTRWFWQESFCDPGIDSDDDGTIGDNTENSCETEPLCIQACYWERRPRADAEKKDSFHACFGA
uniref:Uncharacterized protein n=1 Tax=Talaromyces marneffei PM1 TaxID=1077442 RepID=A0A093VJ76_TALMA